MKLVEASDSMSTEQKLATVCDEVKELLIAKNIQYGDSALHPVRIFSRADNDEQLRVRIDDKLSRLARGNESIENDDDILIDLVGYLVLLMIERRYG